MKSLRSRLILSHILPLLIAIPLTAAGLIYFLETQVLLVNLSDTLADQAQLIAHGAHNRPGVWADRQAAQLYLTEMTAGSELEVMILAPDGRVVAASRRDTLTWDVDQAAMAEARAGEHSIRLTYNLQTPGAIVLVPITDEAQQVVGIVQARQQLAAVSERFGQLRQMVVIMLGGELLLGMLIGLALALRLERPLRRATETVTSIASGPPGATAPVPTGGPRELRRLAEAVNQLAARLAFLEETRRRLLANLVHELGRPLGALRAATHALLGGAYEREELRQQLLTGMEAELRTLQTLVDDLAQLHGQVFDLALVERSPTPLAAWLTTLLSPWREEAQEQGLSWESYVPEELPTVPIDPERMGQALGNLLSNAIKYTPAGGKITVVAGAGAEKVWFTVRDTGPGISPVEQEQIFEAFYRGSQRERFAQGLGLGLTIARDIAQAHGGRLTVESTPGTGSTFRLELPRATDC